MKKVYLAGPLFSQPELEFNRYLKEMISKVGYIVYLPQEDGALLTEMIKSGIDDAVAKKFVFERDINAITECDLLIIILDGRVIDEGAAFELGYAYAQGKTCIGLQTDPRRLFEHGNNPMISESIGRIFSTVQGLLLYLADLVPCKSQDPFTNTFQFSDKPH